MDYRSLVHEKDEAIYSEIRVIVLDIRGFYVSQTDEIRDVFITTFLIKAEHLSGFLSVYDRLSCTTSSARTRTRWPIRRERRSRPCTDAGGRRRWHLALSTLCSVTLHTHLILFQSYLFYSNNKSTGSKFYHCCLSLNKNKESLFFKLFDSHLFVKKKKLFFTRVICDTTNTQLGFLLQKYFPSR